LRLFAKRIEYCLNNQYYHHMAAAQSLSLLPSQWVSLCAQRLQQRWATVDTSQLEEVAIEIWNDERLRKLPPDEAASQWLTPIGAANQGS
jgi:hypothetical protein